MTYRAAPRRRLRKPYDHGQPLRRPDTLILLHVCILLVMLVLLSAPPNTHALVIDLPPPPPLDLPREHFLITDTVEVTSDGTILLNGLAASEQALFDMLMAARSSGRRRGLIFAPHRDARYEDALRTLAVVHGARASGVGFCFGQIERYRSFGAVDRPAPLDEDPHGWSCDPASDWRWSIAPEPLSL